VQVSPVNRGLPDNPARYVTPALAAYQVFLLLVTGVVGVLAARQAVLRWPA